MSSEGAPPAEVQAEENVAIEAEADGYDDSDSAFGPSETASSTASITSSIMNYRNENGRRYHAYREGKYILPNDEEETDRLDLQHELYALTYDGKLYLCPIPEEKQLHRVLDVGTGTGIWAIDFADEHPESQVIGVDLSPSQPPSVPPNLSFEVDDLEERWTFSRKFDFIHSRMMTGSLSDWPRFFKQCYEFLTPGGYLEVSDISLPARVDDDSFPANSAFREWNELMVEAAEKLGRFANSAESYKSQMEAAGFQNVVELRYKWPQNWWPKDPKFKKLGLWSYENLCSNLSGISMALFTRGLGWSREAVEVFLVDVRKEWKDTRIHAYFPIYVVYAQKPM